MSEPEPPPPAQEAGAPPSSHDDELKKVAPLDKPSGRVHTPTVLQMEAVECGAAALAIVLGYYGRFVALERLRIDCGVSRDGSSANNILRAARAYGLKAQGKRLEPDDLKKYRLPLIVHWNMDHFVVVEGFTKTGVYLNDPAVGPRFSEWEEFHDNFSGVAIALETSSKFTKGGHRSRLRDALLRRLKGSEGAVVYVVLVSLLLVLPGLALPTFVRTFVDKVLVGNLTGWIRPLIFGLGLSALVSAVLTAMQQFTLRALETRFALTTSSRFLWHVLRLPMEFYAQRYAGDVGSRVTLNDHVAELLSGRLTTALLNVIVVSLYAVLMFTYDVPLTFISIFIAALNLLVLSFVSRRRKDGSSHVMQEEGKLMGMAMGGLQIIETLKATGMEGNYFARWAGQETKVLNAKQDLGIYNQILQVVPSFLMALNTALILWIGADRVIDGRMSVGMLVAFQTLALSFMTPVTQLVGLGSTLQEVGGSLARLDDVLRYDIDPLLEERPPADEEPRRLSGLVELRDVTFGYSSLAPPLIEGLNLTIKPGDRVAIVGGTGSGKSTIARLVSGLHQPWAGQVFLDGRPLPEIDRRLVTDSVAHVDQEIALFEGTLRDNLTLWDPTVSQAALIRAARDAAIHETIMNRPNGYSTPVEEGGANFSGGQRQRLEIARTLVGDPTILVLDEATSALDPIVEGQIDSNLRRRGCTCLIVAHRLSTIRDCNEIIVLERGKVVQRGTHLEMMGAEGPYARLIQSELAGESEGESVEELPLPEDEGEPRQGSGAQGPAWEARPVYQLLQQQTGRVVRGYLDVFAISEDESRHFLFRLRSGDGVYGGLDLVAIPGPETTVAEAETSEALLEGWVESLSRAATGGRAATSAEVSLSPGQEAELGPQQRAAATHRPLWVTVQEGEFAYLGLEVKVKVNALPFPLSRDTWLEAQDQPGKLRSDDTASLLAGDKAGESLEAFHEVVLKILLERRRQSAKHLLERVHQRAEAEERAVGKALSDLVAIVRRVDYPVALGDAQEDPFLAAVWKVARASGISLDDAAPNSNGDAHQRLQEMARKHHFRYRRVLLRGPWWSRDNGPLLGFRDKHPVALLPRNPNSYREEGADGGRAVNKASARELVPVAFQLYRPLPPRAIGAWELLRFALRGCRRDLVIVAIMGVLGGLLGLIVPVATGFLIKQVIPTADREQVLVTGTALLIAAISMAMFEFTRAVAVQRLEGRIDSTVQSAVWDRILTLPTSFFRSYSAGDLANRAMGIEAMRETLTGSTVSAILGAIFSSFSVALMFYYDPRLALLALLPIGVLVAFTVGAGLYQVRLERGLLEIQGKISGLVLQLLNGIAKIRVAGAEARAFARWGVDFARQRRIAWNQLGITSRVAVINSAFGMVAAIVLFLGVTGTPRSSRLSTGDFLAFYAAFGQFTAALLAVSNSLMTTLSVLPMFERVRPIFEALPELDEVRVDPGPLRGEVELSQVNFRYSEGSPQVLTDVSVRARPGEFVAIVGPSGSGKSTLFRHLLGFEKPDSGAVYYDGQDLEDIDLTAVRRQMGVVLQDSKVMPGDILSNIVGSSGRGEEEAWAAVQAAGLEQDIEEMPMGMHTVIMEGGGAFSGGQRQRLMIARAIVSRPRVLLFDEATSALDSETQEAVTRNLENLRVTRVVIAHRLSTIRNADRIYVMDGGRVVQVGTFDELIGQEGTFARLVRPQTLGK